MFGFQLERLVDVGERFVELFLAVKILAAEAQVVGFFGCKLDGLVQIVELASRPF